MKLSIKIIEYLRLGRLFNAEILSIIFILSYLLSAKLYNITTNLSVILTLFIGGIFAHIWGSFNNDRLDLEIDKKAEYCAHKPLVSGKISLESPISDLTYSELVTYCLNDSELTLKLTTFSDNLVMKLIFILMRITKLPMEDLTRQGVSSWIRNLMLH